MTQNRTQQGPSSPLVKANLLKHSDRWKIHAAMLALARTSNEDNDHKAKQPLTQLLYHLQG